MEYLAMVNSRFHNSITDVNKLGKAKEDIKTGTSSKQSDSIADDYFVLSVWHTS